MNDKQYIDWVSMSDVALAQTIGTFVKHHRLVQNKTQEEEMRQNMEELSATQEDYERNNLIYKEKIIQLEDVILALTHEKASMETKISELDHKHNFRTPLKKDTVIIDRKSYPRRIEYFLDN